jgi:hypothetical protein
MRKCGLKKVLEQQRKKHQSAHKEFGAVPGENSFHAVKVVNKLQVGAIKNPTITGGVCGVPNDSS